MPDSPIYATPREAYFAGVRSTLPVTPGVLSFGAICGAAMVASGLPWPVAVLVSVLVYAGTMQLATIQLLATGAPWAILALAGLIVNLRFVMFSASLSAHLRDRPLGQRIVMSVLMADNAYATAITRFSQHPEQPHKHLYYLGACTTLYAGWQISSAIGIFAGAALPAAWRLDFIALLAFLALGVQNVRDRATLVAALVGAAAAVALAALPFRAGLILAALGGIAAGWATERLMAPRGRGA